MSRTVSHHNSLLLDCSGLSNKGKLFQLDETWLRCEQFSTLAQQNCPSADVHSSVVQNLALKLKKLKDIIRKWAVQRSRDKIKRYDKLSAEISTLNLLENKGLYLLEQEPRWPVKNS